MPSRSEIIAKLAQCKQSLQAQYKIKRIGLFGSYARGEQTTLSDVDVLVEVDPSMGLDFVIMADEIEKTLGLPTDVVSLSALKPRYRQAVEAEVIYV